MIGLSLFSGIGGLEKAVEEYVNTKHYCETNPFCRKVLKCRMESGDLSQGTIWGDVKTISKKEIGYVDIITAGFPCQDISIAIVGKGLEGERSGLFFEIIRLAQEIKPPFLFIENVPAITSRGGKRVVSEIAELGYDCRWCIISASSLGAPHQRKRFFLLAHTQSERCASRSSFPEPKEKRQPRSYHEIECNVSNPWQESPSPLLRVDDGVSNRVDRTHVLGNAVVPLQAKVAFKYLCGLEKTAV
jgi:DNA (cytosine-5)-methyltransferase 1